MRWLPRAAAALLAAEGLAFNPPEDAAGPVTVRLDGPVAIDSAAPFAVRALLANAGSASARGTIRLEGTDGWRSDPIGPVAFTLTPGGTVAVAFTVAPAPPVYDAHYPVHGRLEVEEGGKRRTTHPILIVEAKLPEPHRAPVAASWSPAPVTSDSRLALDRLPAVRAVFQVFGEPARPQPAGWEGSDSATRAYVRWRGWADRGGGREAVVLHPPWFAEKAGTIWAEFPLQLPAAGPLRLTFANAIRDHHPEAKEPPSDGVTFRVRAVSADAPDGALGDITFERHTASKTWVEGSADLSAYAGRTIRLQLESHPGPKRDTTCDESYWADPVLTCGTPPSPAPFPPPADATMRSLGTVACGGTAYDLRLVSGRRGLLDGAIGFSSGGGTLWFRGFHVVVAGEALEDPGSSAVLAEAREEPAPGWHRVRHRFTGPAGSFDLLISLRAAGAALEAAFALEHAPSPSPWHHVHLEDVAAGPWSGRASRVYAGPGNVLQEPSAFELGFDGHRLATSFIGLDFAGGPSLVQATDAVPERFRCDPKTSRYSLHAPQAQTLAFIPAPDVWAGVRAWRDRNGFKAAGGVAALAGRFVFDLWGGPKADEARRGLERAFRYGLTDALVVWHDWQRWGYDYRLPDIWPPNPARGTMEELRALATVCRTQGVLFALHDNYIDLYPDADGFSYDQIAFHPDGRPVRAWDNRWRGAQSYRWRADRVRAPLERNLRLIKEGLAPTSHFIDVWSSIGPYDYWTRDGAFHDRLETRRIWGEAFAWIRKHLGKDAPQFSESGHDALIGWLDGAQANHLRVDRPPAGEYGWSVWDIRCADAERVPWFDAAHHDRFVVHGAGYEPRYAVGLSPAAHGIYSDDYAATEVLTGHPPMVKDAFNSDVVRAYWRLHDAMRALALKRIQRVEFAGGDLHRQRVVWERGEALVNRGKDDWAVDGAVLPPFGYRVRVPGAVEAAFERKDGALVEWCRSPATVYVNPRGAGSATAGPLTASYGCRVTRDGHAVRVTPLPDHPRVEVRLDWDALPWKLPRPQLADALDEDGAIVGSVPLASWQLGVSFAVNPGVFAVRLR